MAAARSFRARALTLCGPRATTTMADVVNPAPRGGASGCWAPPVNEDAADERAIRRARAGDGRGRGHPQEERGVCCAARAGAVAIVDVRGAVWRRAAPASTSRSFRSGSSTARACGPSDCGVIPQLDRIGGAISQISVFFNVDPRGHLIGSTGAAPKLTGRVAGFPEYEHWVLITKDGRLPWIPVTLARQTRC